MSHMDSVLSKAEERIKNGEYYEAEQLFRTLYHRYKKQNKHQDSIEIVFKGCMVLLQYSQFACTADLALLLIDAYNTQPEDVNQQNKDRIIQIFEKFPPTEPSKVKFIKAAINWSGKYGEIETGDPELHHIYGVSLWQEKNYNAAQDQFLYGNEVSSKALGQMTFEWAKSGYKSEYEYFIARAVLLYLSRGNIYGAYTCFDTFTQLLYQEDPSLKTSETKIVASAEQVQGDSSKMTLKNIVVTTSKLPLLNFCIFLILTTQRSSPELFNTLKSKYMEALKKDSVLVELTNNIGRAFFNIQAPGGRVNPFGDMLKSLFAS